MDAHGYVIILLSVRYSAWDMAGRNDCIYKRRASSLPSDYRWAMREASSSRTVTDTASYAFLFINQFNANEGMTAAT